MVKPNINGANKLLFYGFLLMYCMLVAFNIIWYNQSSDLYRQIADLKVGNYTEPGQSYDLTHEYVVELMDQCDKHDTLTTRMTCIVENNLEFQYITRKDSEKLPIDELVKFGGDCGSWSDFFEQIATHYNYSFSPILIPVGERYHRFSIIYDDTGYCYVDMLHVDCVDYDFSINV